MNYQIDERKSIEDAQKGNKREKLPPKERELLSFFITNPDKAFSKEEIIERVWGYGSNGHSATLTVHINRLRKKLEEDARCPKVIETVRGVGYRFNSGALKIK